MTVAVILHSDVPPALLVVLRAYLHEFDGASFVLAAKAVQEGVFLATSLLAVADAPACTVLLPLGCVLAISDSTPDKHPPGFLSGAR